MPTRRAFLGALRGPATAAMVGFRPDAVPRVLAALAASRADDRAPHVSGTLHIRHTAAVTARVAE